MDPGESTDTTKKKPRAKEARSAAERFGKATRDPFELKSFHAVGRTVDFHRIAALPRRTEWKDTSALLTAAFAKPPLPPGTCPKNCPCGGTGTMTLRPLQAWALTEIFEQRGGVGFLGVGVGKTLVCFLLPLLMGWQRPVLFVPAGLRHKTLKIDYPLLSRHWKLPALSTAHGGAGGPGSLEVCSYEELSRVSFADYLALRRVPDGIVADEGHRFKNRKSGRTKRIVRFFDQHPDTEFAVFSGSFVRRSVMDYGHLTLFGLKDKAPLPHSLVELKTWADAIDANVAEHVRPDPGALMDFCRKGETVRDGYRRRLLEAPGIISSPDLSTSVGLIVNELPAPKPPKNVIDAFVKLRNTAELPNDEKCTTMLDQVRHAKELLMGFYYRWDWPKGPDGKPKPDTEWLEARAAWRSYVRKAVARSHGGVWYDTELQVKRGLAAGALSCPKDEYNEWIRIRDDRMAKWGSKTPPVVTEWLSDYMMEFLEGWAEENKGIIWIESLGFLEKMRLRKGANGKPHACFGAGEDEIEMESGDRPVFSSLAHTTGKNLQYAFHKQLWTTPMPGVELEQGIGRVHRPGQKEDDCFIDVVLGSRETWWTFEQARRDARYIEETTNQPQRLNRATINVTDEKTVLDRCDRGDPLFALTGLAKIDNNEDKDLGQRGRSIDDTDEEVVSAKLTRKDRAAIRATIAPTLTEMKAQAKKLAAELKVDAKANAEAKTGTEAGTT